jgi:GntR family transcriptional regulator
MDSRAQIALIERGLDRSTPIPLYFQIAKAIESAIEAGELPAGTLLGSEMDFAKSLGLSRPTMRRAMEYLVDQGLIVRRQGIGTRVVQPKVRRHLELTSLFDDLSRSQRKPTTKVLILEVVEAPAAVAKALGVVESTPVTHLVRLRWAGKLPIAVMTNYVLASRVELTAERLANAGLYQLLRQAGVTLHSAHQVIGARTAAPSEAEQLDEPRGAALLTMERTAYDDHGSGVDFGTHIYAASRYSFELSLMAH